jgi:hypothetical protein
VERLEYRFHRLGESFVRKCRSEPSLADLLDDPILDAILVRDRLTRDDLLRVIEQARHTLARVPRDWQIGEHVEG